MGRMEVSVDSIWYHVLLYFIAVLVFITLLIFLGYILVKLCCSRLACGNYDRFCCPSFPTPTMSRCPTCPSPCSTQQPPCPSRCPSSGRSSRCPRHLYGEDCKQPILQETCAPYHPECGVKTCPACQGLNELKYPD